MQRLKIASSVALLAVAIIVAVSLRSRPSEDTGAAEGRSGVSSRRPAASGPRDGPHGSKSPRAGSRPAPAPHIYAGPTSLAGWTQLDSSGNPIEDGGAWQFVDGALKSRGKGRIAREIPLPPLARLSFTVGWDEQLRLHLGWDASQAAPAPENSMELAVQRGFFYLRKRWMTPESAGSRVLGQCQVVSLAEAAQAQFELRLDRERGLMALLVNGELKAVLVDREPALRTPGDWFFLAAEEGYPLLLSELLIEPWDGTLPDGQSSAEAVAEAASTEAWRESLQRTNPLPAERARRDAVERLQALQAARDAHAEAEVGNLERELAAARQAVLDAQAAVEAANAALPVARPDPDNPGHVLNPFTGESLDVRGVQGRVRDPRDPDLSRTFRVR